MSSKELRDEQGNRLHIHRDHDHLPDDIRRALVLDFREMLVTHPHSPQARRQFLREQFEAGAAWAEPYFNRCFTQLEEQAAKEWTAGQRAVEAERRDREALEKEKLKGTEDPPVVPTQRTDPPSVSLTDDDDDSTLKPLRFTQRQTLTLVQRASRQKILDIIDDKAAAVKRRESEAARVKEMARAEKGHQGVIELAQAIEAAWELEPDAVSYSQVMRNSGLTFKQFGISTKFFADQLDQAGPDEGFGLQ
ncbi:hypothetical protein ASE03_26550 [Kitasatospora sp. Root187]|nr:hypothetical protein ASC99_33815 [Kitasatospora sp. Root107]KRB69789.1 hypothetical protein ASE03_26550 [Kitasatospora sp. Root187]